MSCNKTMHSTPLLTAKNDGWWPDLLLEDLQTVYQTSTKHTPDMIMNCIQSGMLWANKQLSEFKTAQKDAGRKALVLRPIDMLDDDAIRLLYYRRAVFAYAKASLLQMFNNENHCTQNANGAKSDNCTHHAPLEMAVDAIRKFKAMDIETSPNKCMGEPR